MNHDGVMCVCSTSAEDGRLPDFLGHLVRGLVFGRQCLKPSLLHPVVTFSLVS